MLGNVGFDKTDFIQYTLITVFEKWCCSFSKTYSHSFYSIYSISSTCSSLSSFIVSTCLIQTLTPNLHRPMMCCPLSSSPKPYCRPWPLLVCIWNPWPPLLGYVKIHSHSCHHALILDVVEYSLSPLLSCFPSPFLNPDLVTSTTPSLTGKDPCRCTLAP